MNKFFRITALILSIAMLFSLSGNVYAHNQIGSFDISESSLNELSMPLVVSEYFAQRHAFLEGEVEAIDIACIPITNDEAKHRESLIDSGIARVGLQFSIDDITIDDALAQVTAVEELTYDIDGNVYTASIEHILTVYQTQDKGLVVAADEYFESFSNFQSSSYISNGGATLNANATTAGSALCIIEIAKAEIGYQETYKNITKYGEWYGDNGEPWCAIFVSWCAYQANVSQDVIKKDYGCDEHMVFFKNINRFYMSAAYGGTAQPQAGDIIFMGPSQSDSNHVGIVKYVENGLVYFIDGNSSDRVSDSSRMLTNTSILGYGRPNYGNSTHTYSVETTNYNDFRHGVVCGICGYQTAVSHNLVQDCDRNKHWTHCTDCDYIEEECSHTKRQGYNSSQHWEACSRCSYEILEDHILEYDCDADGHWGACTICAYETGIDCHDWELVDDVMFVCKICGYSMYFGS